MDKDLLDSYNKYNELDLELYALTGYRISDLVKLFAAGYTLTPPKEPQSLISFISDCDKIIDKLIEEL